MYIKGKLLTVEFKGWVHPPRDGTYNVIDIGEDNLRARFNLASWDPHKGKVIIDKIYHSVEGLFDL